MGNENKGFVLIKGVIKRALSRASLINRERGILIVGIVLSVDIIKKDFWLF